jgi:hypothetical protein
MPRELYEAQVVDALAERYHVLPSQIRREGTALLRHVNIVRLGEKKAAK